MVKGQMGPNGSNEKSYGRRIKNYPAPVFCTNNTSGILEIEYNCLMSYWEYRETMENHDSKKGGGPGCAVMMLMLPIVMLFGFFRKTGGGKADHGREHSEIR